MNHEDLKALLYLHRFAPSREVIGRLKRGEALGRIRESVLPGKGGADNFDAAREIERCAELGIRLLTWFDKDYPPLLRHIHDPPLLLYVLGDLSEADKAAVAIVGTRHASSYGLRHAAKFASELAQAGWTVVSGLALGIDQASHEGALRIPYGRTVAVLGSGLDRVYPYKNKDLCARIQGQGAVISEYPLGTPPLPHHFPRRNRIISGLSLGVVVVEAHARSGALITANEALEQGREVFAVPGPIDQLTSRGPHDLIRDGACVADSSAVIIKALGPLYQYHFQEMESSFTNEIDEKGEAGEVPAPGSSGTQESLLSSREDDQERKILLELLNEGSKSQNEILENWVSSPTRLFSLLLRLELEKSIYKEPDGRFCLESGKRNLFKTI